MFTDRLARARNSLSFPLRAPDWPVSVARPQKTPELGVHYDTDWARKYPVRLARAVYTEAVTRPLVGAIARPKVRGLDRFENIQGPVIFAANHSSHLDTPVLLSALPDRWRHRLVTLAAADYFFDSKVKAAYFSFALNAVPLERSKVSRRSVDLAQRLAADGWHLLIFPEGGRSPDGWGQEHTAGAAWLAARTGRPLVPVHIEGTGRLWPRRAKRIYTGETTVTFGAPIPAQMGRTELQSALEKAISLLADEARTDWWQARRRAADGSTPSLLGPDASAWRRAWELGPSPKDKARRRSPAGQKSWPPKPSLHLR